MQKQIKTFLWIVGIFIVILLIGNFADIVWKNSVINSDLKNQQSQINAINQKIATSTEEINNSIEDMQDEIDLVIDYLFVKDYFANYCDGCREQDFKLIPKSEAVEFNANEWIDNKDSYWGCDRQDPKCKCKIQATFYTSKENYKRYSSLIKEMGNCSTDKGLRTWDY